MRASSARSVLAMPEVMCEGVQCFGMSQAHVCRARARRNKLGQMSPGPQYNHMPLCLAGLERALRVQVEAASTQTLREPCQGGVTCTAWRWASR